jgi:succinate-acetate transporter protein
MTTETLVIALRIAGLMMSGLVIANFVAAKRLRYHENLAGCDVMVRQIFHVHCAYIIAIVGGLAVLCLGWPQLLLADGMGRVLAGFFGAFWASRVIVQLSYYDKETRRRERGWDFFFLGVFIALSTIFTLTAIFG